MRRVLVLAALTALAAAKPETYKEKEDFQYSRSSSDDGTKSGFYGAQRGNMGGNFERAHNMDSLAQHQMGGLVRTVEGELGDGAKQTSGSVYTAANSRGVYGSGHYDLTNLEGRNFQEGTSYGNSQSHSSLSSHNTGYGGQTYSANSEYGSNSRYGGHHTSGTSGQTKSQYNTHQSTDNLGQTQSQYNTHQSADNLQSSSLYDAAQAAHNSGYSSQTGYHTQSGYDRAAANSHVSNGYGPNIRLVSAQPVRVYVRPGGTVTVPIATQTIDSSHGSASTFDQNAINSEAEVLGSTDQQAGHKPTSDAKHYESSYSYRKEWEKHDKIPLGSVVIPTENPYPSNSELNEDIQAQGSEHQHVAAGQESKNEYSNQYHGYNVKSGSASQSRHDTAYNSQQHTSTSDLASNVAGSKAYTYGAYNNNGASANLNAGTLNNQVEDIASKPKSYQSSYSYHKSWERQGDPYIIKPSTNGVYTNAEASQRLTASSLNQGASGYGSQSQGFHYHQGYNGVGSDCDENGHIRVARSYNLGHDRVPYQQSQDDTEGQQSQNLEDFGQQSQIIGELGQQSQNLEDFGQQSQKLEDLSQQSQNLEDLGQQSQNLEDFSQQAQNLEEFGQQSQKLEDLSQQTQNFGQESLNLEELGQQTQNQWDQQSQTDLGQETQNTWSALETKQNTDNDTEPQLTGTEHIGYTHSATNEASQQKENALEVNMDTINQQQSSTTLDNNSQENPPANPTNFDTHRQEKAETQLDLTHSEAAQHTQSSWNYFQPNNPNVQPFSSNIDAFHNNNPDLQKYLDTYNKHSNMDYGNSQQTHFTGSTGYTNSVNTYTNTQTHVNHHDYSSHSHIEAPAQESGSLNNLWDMLDNIEKDTTSGDEKTNFDFNQSYQANEDHGQASNYFDKTQNLNQHTFNYEDKSAHQVFPSTTEYQIIETTSIIQNMQPREEERGDIGPEKELRPTEDIGRGDIGPDDSSSDTSYAPVKLTNNTLERKPVPLNTRPIYENKTSEKIETLSLTKESNNTRSVYGGLNTNVKEQDSVQKNDSPFENILSVLSISEQKRHEHHNEQNYLHKSSSTTPKNSYLHHTINSEQDSTNIEQQSSDQQFQNPGQEVESQQTFNPSEGFDQQNMGDQMVDFGQQNEDLEQQLQSFNQQNVNLDQQNEHGFNLEQGPDEIQQNIGQQFENSGQMSEHLNQQSFNQFEEFGHQSEHLGQEQLVNFGQQNETFHEENINDYAQQETLQQESLSAFEQNNENHPQKEQQLENWDQQNANLEQQSQVEDLNQEVQTLWKPAENLEQQPQQVDTLASPPSYQKEGREPQNQEPVIESEIQKVTQNSAVESPPETVTEKVGFWSKVGSKFVSAKDKVASWF